jgi:MFS family permease
VSHEIGLLWRHSDFKRLWAAQAVSAFGSRITRTALPVIAILLVTANPMELAVLGSLEVIPAVLIGLLAGGWIDRSKKRNILVAADVSRAVLVFSVPLVAWVADVTMLQLYLIAAVSGASSALFRLTDNAYLPALIGRESLVEGNSKLETTESIAEIGGPGLAGILIQALGAPLAMLLDALSYLWSAAFLTRIEAEEHPAAQDTPRRSLTEDIRVGMRAGFGHRQIGPTFWALGLHELFGGFFMALYMLYAIDTLGVSVAAIGIVIGLGGVGALAGALFAGPVSRWLGLGPAMIATLTLSQASNLFIPLAGVFSEFQLPLLAAHQLLGDAFMVAFMILATSFRQSVLPLEVMARANGTLQAMSGVLLPLGALIAGVLATLLSVTAGIWIGMIGGLAAILPLLRRAIAELSSMPSEGGLPDEHGA